MTNLSFFKLSVNLSQFSYRMKQRWYEFLYGHFDIGLRALFLVIYNNRVEQA
ncbi:MULTISPECIES: hypothetical protein [unclassified Wolbachia]|uniref:hypothetical protein n=1 Tax=unclassified Wolbachia TaxID=2640676 RepID=UPI00223187A8|nr:hypothetical protein [Wolbachia endosymbiont (group A) of Apoderus coryli]